MDQKQLITFLTAAETLNFTKTAGILNFAQSSVTAHIKSLEESLGKPLFERLGKKIVLTEAGHTFRTYADQIVKMSEEAKRAIGGDEEPAGTLIIGAQESQCTYRLPPVLTEFKRRYPNVELIFKAADSDERAREQLMDGTLDLAFITDISKPEGGLTVEPLIQEEIILVAGSDHPIAGKPLLSLKEIEQETLLLTETGCSYRNLMEDSFRVAKAYPIQKFEFTSIEAIKQCVIAGMGIAVLPAMVVERDIEAGRMVVLGWDSDIPPISTKIAWHKDKWMSSPLKAFIDLTRTMFQGTADNAT